MAKYDGNDIGATVYSSDLAIPPRPYNGNYIFNFEATVVSATPVPSSLAPSSAQGGKVFEVRS